MILFPLCGFAGVFNIDVAFDAGMAEGYKSAFTAAVTFWESNIIDYRVNTGISALSINASVAYIDGQYGILGSAGPDYIAYGYTTLAGDTAASYVCYSTEGSMTFDSADVDMMISNGSWGEVIRHEMAHVIGFGTLWGLDLFGDGTIYNDFYVDGSGEYTGAAGLAAYQAEFDPTATFVPVELGGGSGTADGHWNEVDGGAGLTGITTASGDDMRNELMTGWLNSPSFLSQTTLGQFYDLGYEVIPEPATIMMMASLAAAAFWIRRRISYMA
ncbi:MAG: PEP-CTERM sorting domain-containing protein [Kiritimatiellales bacterium]|nr:PEP-CTERM sorting domain-containing protein [Kiritimatiellales bacterium]